MPNPEITEGSVVLYYRPSLNEILDTWSHPRTRPQRRGEGDLKRVTITEVAKGETSLGVQTFYTADDGTILGADDIVEVVS